MAGSSHGHTPAAWTGVTIAFIGFCVAGAFMVMAQPLGFWAGMVIVLLGGVVGMVMRSMGLGMPKKNNGGALVMSHSAPVVTREPVAAEG